MMYVDLDYGDVIFHNSRAYLMNLLEQVQYNTSLVVSGCWQGTNRVKLYNELGWESLSDRRWFRRLTFFYKIVNRQTPEYLFKHLPSKCKIDYNLRKCRDFINPRVRTLRFENSFFPYCITQWEKLSDEIKALSTLSQFKERLLLFIRPHKRSSHGIKYIPGIKRMTKLRVEFSDLRSHRFRHSFNCNNRLCRRLKEEVILIFFCAVPSTFLSVKNFLATYGQLTFGRFHTS